jgi:hypothetical protein
MSEAELGAGPPAPCFDVKPALPLRGSHGLHMTMEGDGLPGDREAAISVV